LKGSEAINGIGVGEIYHVNRYKDFYDEDHPTNAYNFLNQTQARDVVDIPSAKIRCFLSMLYFDKTSRIYAPW
jgi:hypothetical protein